MSRTIALARTPASRRRRSRTFRIARALLSSALGLGSLCCAAARGDDPGREQGGVPSRDDVTSTAEQDLAVNVNVTRWPSTVPICFRNNGGYCRHRCAGTGTECDPNVANSCGGAVCSAGNKCQDNATACSLDSGCDGLAWNIGPPINQVYPANTVVPNYPQRKLDVQGALTDNWDAPSGLSFVFQGDCGVNPPSSTLVINLRNYTPLNLTGTDDSAGSCSYGIGARCEFHANVNAGKGLPDLLYVAVHETGHALGLPHESQRSDAPCPATLAQAQGCEACTDGGCDGSHLNLCTCSSAEFAACFKVSAPPTSVTLTFAQYQNAQQIISDNAPNPNFVGLTKYDPNSVMNYCGSRPQLGSALDRLGIEILYPNSTSLPVACFGGCWASGNTLLLRSDGIVQDDWMARGALAWWTNAPTWKKNGTTIVTSPTLGAGDIGTNSTISFSAASKWSNQTMSGSESVVIDNAKWTAVAAATTSML